MFCNVHRALGPHINGRVSRTRRVSSPCGQITIHQLPMSCTSMPHVAATDSRIGPPGHDLCDTAWTQDQCSIHAKVPFVALSSSWCISGSRLTPIFAFWSRSSERIFCIVALHNRCPVLDLECRSPSRYSSLIRSLESAWPPRLCASSKCRELATSVVSVSGAGSRDPDRVIQQSCDHGIDESIQRLFNRRICSPTVDTACAHCESNT